MVTCAAVAISVKNQRLHLNSFTFCSERGEFMEPERSDELPGASLDCRSNSPTIVRGSIDAHYRNCRLHHTSLRMAHPSAIPATTLHQQTTAINAVEMALESAIFRAVDAFNTGSTRAGRLCEAIVPLKRGVDVMAATLGHEQFNFWMDGATHAHLTSAADVTQAAICKTEMELLEAKQHLLHLTALTQSDLWACERARVSVMVKIARTTIRELWTLTMVWQEEVNIVQAILRSAQVVTCQAGIRL
ncbi:unnamed protein product [Phytophthora fragariaefolia]|uniref:Unnamed protein product n=1 Tax=Phytophthora fragariaefolia TaxID=1490495 RepID=A0A9W7CXX0_9STRA|nr:unnamed protein product [Phytophthora fragariaefolia]